MRNDVQDFELYRQDVKNDISTCDLMHRWWVIMKIIVYCTKIHYNIFDANKAHTYIIRGVQQLNYINKLLKY